MLRSSDQISQGHCRSLAWRQARLAGNHHDRRRTSLCDLDLESAVSVGPGCIGDLNAHGRQARLQTPQLQTTCLFPDVDAVTSKVDDEIGEGVVRVADPVGQQRTQHPRSQNSWDGRRRQLQAWRIIHRGDIDGHTQSVEQVAAGW